MIDIRDFSFRYASSGHFALKNVDLRVEDGEFVLVAGPSGGGKSTLLRVINSLIPHFYGGEYLGSVSVYGKNPICTPPRDMSSIVGTVLQDPENQILMNRVETEIAFGLENLGLSGDLITKRVEEVIDLLDMVGVRHRKTAELSGGEKQKLAIAAVMAKHPKVLLLDEPTSQLDPKSAESILGVLSRLNAELGLTIILVEHRMENTIYLADRMVIFDKGEIIAEGNPREVIRRVDLDKIGVGYPPVSRVAVRKNSEVIPLNVKEAQKYLREYLEGVKIPQNVKRFGEVMLTFKNVKFSYGKRKVLRGVNLNVRKNEVLGIIGRNGSGKTTLGKLMVGIYRQSGGIIKRRVSSKESGMVFQNPNLHVIGDSVFEDVAYTLRARGEIDVKRKTEEVLKYLGIEHLREKNPLDLSGGEKLLFALATVLVFKPRFLVLDEPTRGLSWAHKKRLVSIIKEYSRGRGIVVISHDVELIARVSDTVALLSSGRVVLRKRTRDMLTSSLTYSTQINKLVQRFPEVDQNIMLEEDLGVPV